MQVLCNYNRIPGTTCVQWWGKISTITEGLALADCSCHLHGRIVMHGNHFKKGLCAPYAHSVKMHIALTYKMVIRSGYNFAHNTVARQSCFLQLDCIIRISHSNNNFHKFSIMSSKILRRMGPFWHFWLLSNQWVRTPLHNYHRNTECSQLSAGTGRCYVGYGYIHAEYSIYHQHDCLMNFFNDMRYMICSIPLMCLLIYQ